MEMSLLGPEGVSHPGLHVETLTMSRKERNRLKIMAGVKAKELSQVQAAELIGLGYRQAKRVWRRYREEGDAGLVHRLRGKPGLRRKPAALRTAVLQLCAQERYGDFGPTLMAEELAQQGLVVDHDTLRRWWLAAGRGPLRRRRQQHRQWRERKPCLGAMIQLDGGAVFRSRNHPGQLRRIRGLGASARAAGGFVCGPGQHLPLRRPGQRGRATGGPGAPNAIWPGDGAIGGGVDFGPQPPGQGAGGTDERGVARPAGQGAAVGRH